MSTKTLGMKRKRKPVVKNSNKMIDRFFLKETATQCSQVQSTHEWLRFQFPYDNLKSRVDEACDFYREFDKLNERQLAALLKVRQGKNLFLTGSAGTGKTLWMSVAVGMLQSMNKSVYVCATTARAASNIEILPVSKLPPAEMSSSKNHKRRRSRKPRQQWDIVPRTLHSFAGIGIEDFDPVKLGSSILNEAKYRYTLNRWRYCDVLFIDEVSMLHPKLFAALDQMAQVIRRNSRPWGGIQLIFVADFFQLPPVDKDKNLSAENANSLANETTLKMIQQQENLQSTEESSDENENNTESSEEHVNKTSKFVEEQRRKQLALDSLKTENELLEALPADQSRCCFQTIEWHNTVQDSILLDQVFRQNNAQFIDLLCQLRRGKLSESNIALLETRTRYRLKDDLLNIAHEQFGGQGCGNLRQVAREMLDLMLENPKLSKSQVLEHVQINPEDNMWQRAGFVPESLRKTSHCDWNAVFDYLQKCSEESFDADEVLIRALEVENVPESHRIMVSRIRPTFIMSKNEQVNTCNSRNLAAIRTPMRNYGANISIEMHNSNPNYTSAQQHFVDTFKKNNSAPLQLSLKIGAQVLLIANIKPPTFVNGKRGIVVGFETQECFEQKYGKDALFLGSGGTDTQTANVEMPIVQFEGGFLARVGVYEWESKRSFSAGRPPIVGKLQQIPLILAFAITIHRSQGMTIDPLSANLTGAFESGLPYVALSRAVSLDRLIIEELDPSVFDGSNKRLLPPPEVLALYNRLERETKNEIQALI